MAASTAASRVGLPFVQRLNFKQFQLAGYSIAVAATEAVVVVVVDVFGIIIESIAQFPQGNKILIDVCLAAVISSPG